MNVQHFFFQNWSFLGPFLGFLYLNISSQNGMITIPDKIQLNPIFRGLIGHLGCTTHTHTPRSHITVGHDMRENCPQFFVSSPASRL